MAPVLRAWIHPRECIGNVLIAQALACVGVKKPQAVIRKAGLPSIRESRKPGQKEGKSQNVNALEPWWRKQFGPWHFACTGLIRRRHAGSLNNRWIQRSHGSHAGGVSSLDG
jgi:hypothetical protein